MRSPQNKITREYIRFTPQVPVEITLDYGPEGKAKESTQNRGQVDWQYTVNNGTHLMYLPATARTKLLRTGAQAGDLVRIIKLAPGEESDWHVEVLTDAAEPEPEPAPLPPQRATRPAPVQQMPSRAPYQHSAAAVAPAAPHREQPQPQPAATSSTMVDLMATCFVVAAKALGRAHAQITQAEDWQHLEPPTWEDVRSTAASLFIERNRQLREGGSR